MITPAIVHQFMRSQISMVPIQGLESVTGKLMPAFRLFLARPDAVKKSVCLDWDPDRKVYDTGYSVRDDDESKEVFHYQLGMEEELRKTETPWRDEENLLPTAREAWKLGYATALLFAHHFDRMNPRYNLAKGIQAPENIRKHKVRLLHYKGTTANSLILAKQHTDIGGITITLQESWPAVQGEKLLEPKRGYGFIFSGEKLAKITKGVVPAFPHSVVDRRVLPSDDIIRDQRRESLPRMSAVMFIHPF